MKLFVFVSDPVSQSPTLSLILDNAAGFKSDLHYDVNRKLPQTIRLEKSDLVAFSNVLEEH